MFILETNDVGTAMFAKGQKVESYIDLWHKRINHVNFQRLQGESMGMGTIRCVLNIAN